MQSDPMFTYPIFSNADRMSIPIEEIEEDWEFLFYKPKTKQIGRMKVKDFLSILEVKQDE